jgi:subtilisin family serine protease
MKRIIPILLTLALLVSFSAAQADDGAQVLDPTALFVPDITGVLLESEAAIPDVLPSALTTYLPFNADLVNAEKSVNSGQGVYVAVLDTGLINEWPMVFEYADIAEELGKGFSHDVYWDDAVGDIMFGPLRDDRGFLSNLSSGHGTHVTSIITGFARYASVPPYAVRGVAPAVTIIPVLVLDAWEVATPYGAVRLSGGTDEMVSAGIYYVADLAETLDGPVVINMSLGGPERSTMIEEAVNYAISKGVIVVASAGNNGTAGMGYPGGLPQIISAAAGGWATMFNYSWRADAPEKLNTKDVLGNNWQIYLEDFSSRPNKALDQKHQDLDVTTPGAWVVGPYRPAFSTPLGYYYVSGTSQAAPHVTAIAALVLQTHPDLTQAEMEAILENTARGIPLPADDAVVAYPGAPYMCTWDGGDAGAGFLQADSAIRVANIMDK